MSDEIRRVRALRLRAPDEASALRARLLLEDALHVADIAAARGSRLLYLRRVDLGPIDPDESPAALGMRVQQRVGQLAASAVHAASPEAATAQAVFFADPIEPLVALAVRIASGQPADDWFWNAALPRSRVQAGRAGVLRFVLAELGARPEALAGMTRLVRALVERQVLQVLVESLQPEDGPVLLHALGVSPEATRTATRLAGSVSADAGIRAPLRLTPAGDRTLAAALETWGTEDARGLWLALVLIALDHGVPMLSTRAVESARAAVAAARRLRRSAVPAVALSDAPATAAADVASDRAVRPPRAGRAGRARQPPTPGSRARPSTLRFASEPPASPQAPPPPPGNTAAAVVEGDRVTRERSTRERLPTASRKPQEGVVSAATAFGGLLFLANALDRLGLEAWLRAHPAAADSGFAVTLLSELAWAVGCPFDDPMLHALPSLKHAAPALDGFCVPAQWRESIAAPGPLRIRGLAPGNTGRLAADASGRLCMAQWRGFAPEDVRALSARMGARRDRALASGTAHANALSSWRTALRRWVRRHAGTGLDGVIRRRARVAATATHLDVFLLSGSLDIRLRRVGLDFDPGWVPWLGRVVAFHYGDEHEHG